MLACPLGPQATHKRQAVRMPSFCWSWALLLCILPEQQGAPGTPALCRLPLGRFFCLRRRAVGWQLQEGAGYEGRTRLQSPPCSVRTACARGGVLHPQLSQPLESKCPKSPFSRALGTATRPPMPRCRLARPADARLPSPTCSGPCPQEELQLERAVQPPVPQAPPDGSPLSEGA